MRDKLICIKFVKYFTYLVNNQRLRVAVLSGKANFSRFVPQNLSTPRRNFLDYMAYLLIDFCSPFSGRGRNASRMGKMFELPPWDAFRHCL